MKYILLVLLLLSDLVSAATVTWLPPTHRGNGAALPVSEIAGYTIRYKLTDDSITQTRQIVPGTATQYVPDFTVSPGYSLFQIAAYDTNGLYSDFADIDTSMLPADPLVAFSQTIEAENYTSMSGVYNEPTTDVAGGQDTGSIDTNDWMSYSGINVKIPTAGVYKISYRVASLTNICLFSLNDAVNGTLYDTVTVPVTGGWQNWITIERTITLTAGNHTFDIKSINGGFNVNWFKIESISATSSSVSSATSVVSSSSIAASSSSSSIAASSSSSSKLVSSSSIKSVASSSLNTILTIPFTSKKIPPVVPVGLKGAYYVYKSSVPALAGLAQVNSTLSTSNPSFTFTATTLQYGMGDGNLIVSPHYKEFLKSDALTISRNPSTIGTGAIIHLTGMIKLPVGQFSLRVNSDDGYSISINKKIIAEYNGNQAPTSRDHLPFKITTAGYYPIDIIYWDAGGQYVFEVKIANTVNGVYNVVDKAILFNF